MHRSRNQWGALTDHEVCDDGIEKQRSESHWNHVSAHLSHKEGGHTIESTHILVAVRCVCVCVVIKHYICTYVQSLIRYQAQTLSSVLCTCMNGT